MSRPVRPLHHTFEMLHRTAELRHEVLIKRITWDGVVDLEVGLYDDCERRQSNESATDHDELSVDLKRYSCGRCSG